MKKFLLFLFLFFSFFSFANANDYEKLYEQTEVPDFKFHNNLDPFQNEDYIKYAYSPYPLFRTSANLIFKTIKIPAGYYILTPRTYKGKDVVLFKVAGKVEHIVPAVQTNLVEPGFYALHIPKPKKTKWQNAKDKFYGAIYKIFKGSKKQEGPKSYITSEKQGNSFLLVKVYYGEKSYLMIFKPE